jgi:IS5 family transposase
MVRGDPRHAPAPKETTILNFRRIPKQHDLRDEVSDTVNPSHDRKSIRISTNTIDDTTITSARLSTGNEKKGRLPRMHQTRRGSQWYIVSEI